MRATSETITAARIAADVKIRGSVSEVELELILRDHSVNQQTAHYRKNLLAWGYLVYDRIEHRYHTTDAGAETVMIPILVPRLNSKEIRRHLVQTYSGYAGVIEIGEVERCSMRP